MTFTLIAGPCVIESRDLALEVAERVKAITDRLGIRYVFKASYDKANRSSGGSFRGPGVAEGLAVLAEVKESLGIPVLTDIHESQQAAPVAEVVDLLQIPAFLCRQTDLLEAAARTGRIVNIKKGQFVSPWDIKHAADKVAGAGNSNIFLTERGSSFGYNNLVVDMRSLAIMRGFGWPVVFDATHSVQMPGAGGTQSGGQPEFIEPLARAAVAVGIDALFVEVHENPANALSDGANALPLSELAGLWERLLELDAVTRRHLPVYST